MPISNRGDETYLTTKKRSFLKENSYVWDTRDDSYMLCFSCVDSCCFLYGYEAYTVVRQIKRGLILQIKTDFFNRLAMV